MPSDPWRRDAPITIVGVPSSRRVREFAAAAERVGRRVEITSYLDAVANRFRGPTRGAYVRLESPGECAATTRALLKAGSEPLEAAGGVPLSAAEVDELRCDRGEIPSPRQWFFGFRRTLDEWEDERPDVRWMSSPTAIVTAFDKSACLQQWTQAGLPVPRRFPDAADYLELRERIPDRHARVFIKLRYGYSAVGAAAVEWSGKRVRAITTVDVDWGGVRPRLFLSKQPRILNSERDVARLIDLLSREETIVEAWLPKARWDGVPFDLRMVVIGGKVRHVVGRAGSSPFTNLNLGARRLLREAVEQRLGASWSTAENLAERAAALIPGALVLGMDLLVRPGLEEFALLEANAFGDYLPDLLHEGETTYDAALRAVGSATGELV